VSLTFSDSERLSLSLAAANLGDWSWDAATDRVTFSERAAAIFEIPPGPHMTWREMRSLLHPDDAGRAHDAVQHAIETRSDYKTEYRLINGSGERWVSAMGRPIYDSAGSLVGMLGVVQDITESVRMKAALLLSEQRFRGIMEQSPLSMQVLSRIGSTIRVNRAWEQLWGATIDTVRDYNILADPQLDAAGITPLLQRAFAGEVVDLPTIRYDPNETLPDSSANPDPARWVSAFAYPVKNAAGEVEEVVLVHRDVTAVREAEARLAWSEARLRLALEASRMNVWDWDLATDIVACSSNAREFWGIDIGRAADFTRVIHPDDQEAVAAAAAQAIANPTEPYFSQYRLLAPDGRLRWVESRGRVDRDDAGRAVRLLGVTLDVTELKTADQRKDEFLATLAHELRNPLAPIRTSAALLKSNADARLVERTRAIIERQVGHLVRLVDDLLDVSRISRGKLVLTREPVDLAAIVATALETSRPVLDAAELTLTTHLPSGPVVVLADRVRLAQAISNILNNAAKFTPAGGAVDVAFAVDDAHVSLRITDSGIGIPTSLLDQVFEMFVQGPAGRRSASGLGIGLTIVKRLVELHDGVVRAESAGDGAGSTFVITLPVVEGNESRPESSLPEPPATRASRRVLVVDDNVDAADTLAALLAGTGDEVRTATSGAAALAILDHFTPEVALLDIGLPDTSGYDLARSLRARFGSRITLIAITGWGQDADRARAAAAGFDHHLTKPVDHDQLHRLME